MRYSRRVTLPIVVLTLLSCSSDKGTGPITPAPVATITVSPGTRTMTAGEVVSFSATPYDAAGSTVSNVSLAWSSSDTAIATVSAAGSVTARRTGMATITAAGGGRTGTATVTVVAGAASRLTLWSGNAQVAAAGAALPQDLVVAATDLAGNPIANVDVAWAVLTGGGSLSVATARTGANGLAATRWTLGAAPAAQTAQASVTGLAGSPVVFTANVAGPQAVRRTWVGGTAGNPVDWSTAGNWSPAGVPSNLDTAVVAAAATQPQLNVNVAVNTLIVQAGATLNTSGYETSVVRNVDVAGAITGNGSVLMTGAGTTVRGAISTLLIDGGVSASGAVNAGSLTVRQGGSFTLNGQTVTVAGAFGASSGTITMTTAADVLVVGGTASFGNMDQTGKLTAGTIRVGGNFETGCYNNTEFVPTGTRLVMNGTTPQAITMCSSSTGNRLFDLTIAAGAVVTTSSNPVFIATTLMLNGRLSVAANGVVDVAGPAGSLTIAGTGVLANLGIVRANLPITNNGTVTGNAVVQR